MDSFGVNFLNLAYLFNQVYLFLTGVWLGDGNFNSRSFYTLLEQLFFLSIFLSIILIAGIVYFWQRLKWLERLDEEKYAISFMDSLDPREVRNTRWERVIELISTESESDWKLAILEADKMLDEMVEKMGYIGTNLGERLKVIEPSDFKTLPEAWEAHKVRNRIAHEHDMRLNKRDARRVIDLFEKVFREFNFI